MAIVPYALSCYIFDTAFLPEYQLLSRFQTLREMPQIRLCILWVGHFFSVTRIAHRGTQAATSGLFFVAFRLFLHTLDFQAGPLLTRLTSPEVKTVCRKVGAHRKESAKAKNRTPVQAKYAKVYSRLKTRKCRGKISVDNWNAVVAKAMEIRDMAERGEIDDVEMRRMFVDI